MLSGGVLSKRQGDTVASILLAEDDKQLREMLCEMLEHQGHCVGQAADGQEALDLLVVEGAQGFNLVVCDLLMPRLDGLEMLRAMRKTHPKMKTIAITGSGKNSRSLLPAAKHLGAQATLVKPFGVEEFQQAIDSLLST